MLPAVVSPLDSPNSTQKGKVQERLIFALESNLDLSSEHFRFRVH